ATPVKRKMRICQLQEKILSDIAEYTTAVCIPWSQEESSSVY
ncbi:unnamed protein product, partial [Allacma fusca]